MVFNFIESGINLFDDTFNTIKTLFADVATQAAVNTIASNLTSVSNRVTTLENSSELTIVNASPSFTPKIRMGGYRAAQSGGGFINYFYVDWSIDSDYNNYFRLQIRAQEPYAASFLIKETGSAMRQLFSFNVS